jgi:N6-L-threonylcarbamoyladenine synthase
VNVLGIESSCDETAAAVVSRDGRVVSEAISSQVKIHAPYGGIVPELASRAHVTNIVPVIRQTLQRVDGGLDGVDAVAVTQGPGLVGALLVGLQAAKAIAWARSLPIVGVNHLVGHLLSVHLKRDASTPRAPVAYPYISLLASGGHTALYEVRGPLDVEQLGQTRDDAAGEAFDKVAKLVGLGYPGGPIIDRLAETGDARAVELPRPMAWKGSLDFSFSGLKTAVAQHLKQTNGRLTETAIIDLCASFQRAVIEVLIRKCLEACRVRRIDRLVLAGGVAANRGLRSSAVAACVSAGVELHLPPLSACTDNAAMIAYAGACRLDAGERDDLELNVFSRSPILGARPGSPATRRYKSSKLPRNRQA